jgi:hypothetical protein
VPKDISTIYASYSYGKQYEELLVTVENIGNMWYAMVKICDTGFA